MSNVGGEYSSVLYGSTSIYFQAVMKKGAIFSDFMGLFAKKVGKRKKRCEPFFVLLAIFVQHKVRIVSSVGGEYS